VGDGPVASADPLGLSFTSECKSTCAELYPKKDKSYNFCIDVCNKVAKPKNCRALESLCDHITRHRKEGGVWGGTICNQLHDGLCSDPKNQPHDDCEQ